MSKEELYTPNLDFRRIYAYVINSNLENSDAPPALKMSKLHIFFNFRLEGTPAPQNCISAHSPDGLSAKHWAKHHVQCIRTYPGATSAYFPKQQYPWCQTKGNTHQQGQNLPPTESNSVLLASEGIFLFLL